MNQSDEKTLRIKKDRARIVPMLQSGAVAVNFVKVDGESRNMLCTLDPTLMSTEEINKERRPNENIETVRVWDLDKEAWRSFRVDSVKSVQIYFE